MLESDESKVAAQKQGQWQRLGERRETKGKEGAVGFSQYSLSAHCSQRPCCPLRYHNMGGGRQLGDYLRVAKCWE